MRISSGSWRKDSVHIWTLRIRRLNQSENLRDASGALLCAVAIFFVLGLPVLLEERCEEMVRGYALSGEETPPSLVHRLWAVRFIHRYQVALAGLGMCIAYILLRLRRFRGDRQQRRKSDVAITRSRTASPSSAGHLGAR